MERSKLGGQTFNLDLGQQVPVKVQVVKIIADKVKVKYLMSYNDRYEEFDINDFAKLACITIE